MVCFKSDDQIRILNRTIPELESLEGVTQENINKLAKLLGAHCHAEVKSEAHFYRLKRSREDGSFSTEEILDKQHNVEVLHSFYEAVTKKSGRVPSEHRHKVAPLQAIFYESVLKGANLNCVGPFNFSQTVKMLTNVQSKHVFGGSLGGSHNFHNKISFTEPLPITQKGPLVLDNAQRGKGKYQHFGHGKLDRSAPVSVCTHHIRLESLSDNDDNSIFKDPINGPSNHEHHPVFRPVSPDFLPVVKARIEGDAKYGRRAADRILQTWIDELQRDRDVGGGKTSPYS